MEPVGPAELDFHRGTAHTIIADLGYLRPSNKNLIVTGWKKKKKTNREQS